MAEDTHISWADDTFNPWIGCMKVGPACDGCYAEALMGMGGRMQRVEWGAPGEGIGTRVRTAPSNWAKPKKWNREQGALLEAWVNGGAHPGDKPAPRFVFCASLADVFDNAVPPEWRRDLFDLIRATPHLTWLLLTKRPQNIAKLFAETITPELRAGHQGPEHLGRSLWPRNAAMGCTVVTQAEADRDVPHLLMAKMGLHPAFAFLSMEPLIEAVDLTNISTMRFRGADVLNALTGELSGMFGEPASPLLPHLDWVITGGETDQGGHKSRPQDPEWFRSLRDQCATTDTPFHHKQNGEWCEFGGRGIMADGSMNFLGKPDNAPNGWAKFGDGDDVRVVTRVGKSRSGRFIDGALHDARPTP